MQIIQLIVDPRQIENEIKHHFPNVDKSFVGGFSKHFPSSDINRHWNYLQSYLLKMPWLQNIRPEIEETLNTINRMLGEVEAKTSKKEFNKIKSRFEKGNWKEASSLLSKYLSEEKIREFETYVSKLRSHFETHFKTIVEEYNYLKKYTLEQLKFAQLLYAQVPAYHDTITKFADQLKNVKFAIDNNKLLISGLPEIKFLKFKINENSFSLKTSFLSGEINFGIPSHKFVASLASMKSLSLSELTTKLPVESWKLSLNVEELLKLKKYYENFKVYGIPLSEIFEVLNKNKILEVTLSKGILEKFSQPSISSKMTALGSALNIPINVKDIEGSFPALMPFFLSSPEIYEKGPVHSKDQRSFASDCFAGGMDYESISIPVKRRKIYHRKGSGDLQFSIPGLAGISARSSFSVEEIGSTFGTSRKVGPLTLSASSRLGVMHFNYSPISLFVGNYSAEIAKGGSLVLPSLALWFEVNYQNISAGCELTPSVGAKISEDIKFSPKLALPYLYVAYKVLF